MPEQKGKCKCAMAAFTYADDTHELHRMALERRTAPGEMVADRVVKAIENMREHCGLDIKDDTIYHAKDVKAIFKGKKVWENLTVREAEQVEHFLYLIESDIVTKLQECAKKE